MTQISSLSWFGDHKEIEMVPTILKFVLLLSWFDRQIGFKCAQTPLAFLILCAKSSSVSPDLDTMLIR